jgi:DNA-binding MarR family transcriptional regulator
MATRKNKEKIANELELLRRMEELLTLIAKALLAERLSEIFDDKQHRLIYEKVGQLPVTELAKKSDLSAGTISALWQRWERAGLLVKAGKQYRRVI